MVNYLIGMLSFIFGMCIGSFLNVCIYRLPASQSIVYPGSTCPNCNSPIAFYDNIPVLSYLWLRAKCRHCKMPIPIRYLLVEIIGGFFALSVWIKFGLTFEALIYFAFITSLIVITFIDMDHRIIPDAITLPGIVIGFLVSFLIPITTYKDSILGLLAGGGSLFVVASIYYLITKKDGMGGGDIKLLAMIGAFLGWKSVLFTLFVSSAVGALIGVIIMLGNGKNLKLAVPFGPFLSLGAISYIFFGSDLILWYFSFWG